MANVWEDLRERLDQMSTGYPSTETGIELEILRTNSASHPRRTST